MLTGDDVLGLRKSVKCLIMFTLYRRMSGAKVNLTVHESSEAGEKVMEVRLRLEEAVINIRYSEQ